MDITNVLNIYIRSGQGIYGRQRHCRSCGCHKRESSVVGVDRITRSTNGPGHERGIVFIKAFNIRLPLGITMPINNSKRRHNAISLESVLFPARLCIFWFMWLPRLLRLVILDRIIDEAHDPAHAFLILHIQLQELYQAEVVY